MIRGYSYAIVGRQYLALRRSLQRRVIGSSRKDTGISFEEAGRLIDASCDDAVTGTIKGAVAAFMAAVEEPIQTVTVSVPVRMYFAGDSLRIGHTTYYNRIPRSAVRRQKLLELVPPDSFSPPIASTTVRARDGLTGQLLAAERFAESNSILDLLESRSATPSVHAPLMIIQRRDGSAAVPQQRSVRIVNDELIHRRQLVPPFLQLSRAVAKEEAGRTDWARRVLAAARWYSSGTRRESPADRLASFMVALETLFIEGITERQKGSLVAERITARFQIAEMSPRDQRTWLEGLYRGRNAAVHSGHEFDEDLDVDRLAQLTFVVIRQMGAHLDPGHRPKGRACTTFKAAMLCSLRP